MDLSLVIVPLFDIITAHIVRSGFEVLIDNWPRLRTMINQWRQKHNESTPLASLVPGFRQAIAGDAELQKELESSLAKYSSVKRAAMVLPVISGANILWVDDSPTNNTWECMFQDLGATCVAVEWNESAMACLRKKPFDVIISDINRGEDSPTGIEFMEKLRRDGCNTPLVFYVGDLRPEPAPYGSQGITDHPNELLHLVLDQLERYRV